MIEIKEDESLMNRVLDWVDFRRLEASCNSEDTSYAKEVLSKLHNACKGVYGTEYLSADLEFVTVPAVIRGKETGYIGLGIVSLDLQSSGEHWNTIFITPYTNGEFSVIKHNNFIKKNFMPYDYWYTMDIACDCHVDFSTMPDSVARIINKVRVH